MGKKLQNIVCMATISVLISCNSNPEKKIETGAVSASPVNTPSVSPPVSEIAQLEQKLALDTNNIQVLLELGGRYYAAENRQKAAQYFAAVYRKDPKNPLALGNLGNIYYDTHQFDIAASFYENALAVAPNNIDMRCDLATCYSELNKLDAAIEILKTNVQKNPNHPNSHYNLNIILRRKGQIKEADKELSIYNTLKSIKAIN